MVVVVGAVVVASYLRRTTTKASDCSACGQQIVTNSWGSPQARRSSPGRGARPTGRTVFLKRPEAWQEQTKKATKNSKNCINKGAFLGGGDPQKGLVLNIQD